MFNTHMRLKYEMLYMAEFIEEKHIPNWVQTVALTLVELQALYPFILKSM